MRRRLAALGAVFYCLAPIEVGAQAVACDARQAVGDRLAAKYGEAPVAMGLSSTGQVVEVFAAPDGSTFTIIYTSAAGVACVVAGGESWEFLTPAPAGDPT